MFQQWSCEFIACPSVSNCTINLRAAKLFSGFVVNLPKEHFSFTFNNILLLKKKHFEKCHIKSLKWTDAKFYKKKVWRCHGFNELCCGQQHKLCFLPVFVYIVQNEGHWICSCSFAVYRWMYQKLSLTLILKKCCKPQDFQATFELLQLLHYQCIVHYLSNSEMVFL